MKSFTDYIVFSTKNRKEMINITPRIEHFISGKIEDGFLMVSAMHTTSGIFINDADSGLITDIEELLERLAPFGKGYHHHHTGEDNGDAHLKSMLVHHQVILPITSGKLDLGPWQQVFYAEFDGQRRKRVLLKAIGE
ncbi:YjbQ family protein [Candidatus Woesearchaeota archaeon]|nr:YjbQ family protein [Candidatus Woesearchaeota archaeon]